jgi:hypothetical protein
MWVCEINNHVIILTMIASWLLSASGPLLYACREPSSAAVKVFSPWRESPNFCILFPSLSSMSRPVRSPWKLVVSTLLSFHPPPVSARRQDSILIRLGDLQ